jgi:molybdenum cofactor guanylyltransferase
MMDSTPPLDGLSPARDTGSVLGVVLAGGLGSRMQAALPKALIEFQSRPMIAHVLQALALQLEDIVINANQQISSFSSFGRPLVSDQVEGYVGPLAGLHAAMSAFPQFHWYLMAPCDSPFLPSDLLERFMSTVLQKDVLLTSAICKGQTHPVFALVHQSQLASLSAYLQSGGRKIDRWYMQQGYLPTEFFDETCFLNLNTPEELAAYSDVRSSDVRTAPR